ncbi:MAG TPA: UvrB/UvrC motif-containing protein [Elusimicrobiales bacterium]|nr:UvrB/UvrC motif-containing protein [Elusimicrobiales bacterium]
MKLCEECHKAPAAVFLKLAVNNKVTTVHLCEGCAAKKSAAFGAETGIFNISDIVGNMNGYLNDFLPAERGALACRACGLKYSRFRETGRLGCPACYKSFEPQLTELMKRIHGSARHTGRAYAGGGAPKLSKAGAARRLEALKTAIMTAVEKEDFETAARLRDALRELENRRG